MASSTSNSVAAKKKPVGAKKPKSSPSHPPFFQMITEAIVTLKEKTGSSQYAITKFIEEKHKQLPASFRKLLLHHLKKLVASDKLVKVKNSFKLPSTAKKTAAVTTVAAAKPKSEAKSKTAAKPKPKTAAKPKPKAAVAAKPKAKAGAKPKTAAVKPKAKVAKTAARTSPGKKKTAAVVAKPKKAVAVTAKGVKKPKSVKSPAKKATVKKGKK